MNRACALLPLAAAIAAGSFAIGCKRAPLSGCHDAAACDGGRGGAGGRDGGDGPAGSDRGFDVPPGDVPPPQDASDATSADADADASDASGADADANGGGGSAACVVNPSAPSYAFIGTAIDCDEDGLLDSADNCPWVKNAAQADGDGDGLGDACDSCPAGADRDKDGVCDAADDCPDVWNPAQTDVDGNHVGDACDTPGCNAAVSAAETQRDLDLLLAHPEVASLLAGRRWRMANAGSYCTNGNKRGIAFTIYDYDGRQTISANLRVDDDTLMTLQTAPFATSGPQASAAESYEAIALARADAAVKQRVVSSGPVDPSIFFFEYPNDPRFAACAAGRCVDVLFSTSPGGQIVFTAVVDLGSCRVLGVHDGPP